MDRADIAFKNVHGPVKTVVVVGEPAVPFISWPLAAPLSVLFS